MKRSPNYPALGLSEALEKVKAVFQKEHSTEVAPEVMVGHFGYGGLNGPARTTLSALKKYALISEGKTGLRVSDLAMKILHPENEDERQAALREAAMRPELFRQLAETHPKASDENIANHLIKRGFSAAGAQQAIAAFRDTFTLVNADHQEYTPQSQEEEPMVMSTQSAAVVAPARTGQANIFTLQFPYGDEQVLVKIETTAQKLRKPLFAKVRRYLELAEDDARDEGS